MSNLCYSVACAGVYDWIYKQLYDDGNSGCTTAKKLWENHRLAENDPDGITVNCNCCKQHEVWKESHSIDFQRFKDIANEPIYYKIFSSKKVVIENGNDIVYTGTIHSVACTGKALSNGDHPFQCDPCHSLVHGQSSSLLRKYNRSKTLKYPCTDQHRATKAGVTHKFCSVSDLENALRLKTVKAKTEKEKLDQLNYKIEKLLDDWYQNYSTAPFIKSLHSLIANKQLSDFDLSFLTNWTGKIVKGQHYRADMQARALAVLYCNKLGEKNYNEISPLLGLPC